METRTPQGNMIAQQVRTWNVTAPNVIQAIEEVPREAFVPKKYKKFAYADMQIPIRSGQVMISPTVEGRLLQALAIKKTDHVLEIGTGTGYTSAILGKLAKDVISVDVLRAFSDDASLKLVELGVNNVRFQTGDAAAGWESGVPFDAILITGGLPELPESFKNMLTVGGRIVSIVGDAPNMQAVCVERISNSDWKVTSLFDTVVPVLKNVSQPEEFNF